MMYSHGLRKRFCNPNSAATNIIPSSYIISNKSVMLVANTAIHIGYRDMLKDHDYTLKLKFTIDFFSVELNIMNPFL